MRVYLPSTVAGLRAALASGAVEGVIGYAVTPALREWYVEGDQDELEYAAAAAAARASLELLAAEADRSADADLRRVVLAVELPESASPVPAPDLHRAALRLSGALPWSSLDAALVDDTAALPDVRAALDALPRATAGDADAAFAVASVEAHELGWWATQELPGLVAR